MKCRVHKCENRPVGFARVIANHINADYPYCGIHLEARKLRYGKLFEFFDTMKGFRNG